MDNRFSFADFLTLFPNDTLCLEEIIKLRFPEGIFCYTCNKTTRHYKLIRGNIYACKFCRRQFSPLVGTLFEKSTTSLRMWFFSLFLMTHTRGEISAKQLQRELNVTYKTAWRMHKSIKTLMEQNNGDLLQDQKEYKERKWLFFSKLEIKVVHKQEPFDNDEDNQ